MSFTALILAHVSFSWKSQDQHKDMQETPPVYCLLHHNGASGNKHHRRNKDPLAPDCLCWLPTCRSQNTSVFSRVQHICGKFYFGLEMAATNISNNFIYTRYCILHISHPMHTAHFQTPHPFHVNPSSYSSISWETPQTCVAGTVHLKKKKTNQESSAHPVAI